MSANWNMIASDMAAHKVSKKVPRCHVSKVSRNGKKKLAKSSTWEDVKRRRLENDTLMNGGHGREFEPEMRLVLRDGELVSEKNPSRSNY